MRELRHVLLQVVHQGRERDGENAGNGQQQLMAHVLHRLLYELYTAKEETSESLKNHYLTALIAHFGVLNKIMYEGFNVHKVFSPLFFKRNSVLFILLLTKPKSRSNKIKSNLCVY